MFKKQIALILCMVMILSAFVPSVLAANIIIDTEGLWGDEEIFGDENNGDNGDSGAEEGENGGEDTGDSGNTGDGDNTGDSGNDGDDGNQSEGDNTPTYIPEDNKGEDVQVVGPKDDKDDDKTTVLPSEEKKEEKPEEKPEEDTTDDSGIKKPAAVENAVTPKDFSDVKSGDWFYSDVRYLAGMGIINGYNDGTFRPEDSVTRAEVVKLLVAFMTDGQGLLTTYDKIFDDVELNEWYADYIVTAIVLGIINPSDYGAKFGPDEPITRREVAKLIVNALLLKTGGYKTPYADTADHNIIALYRYGLMQGNYDPATGARFFYPDTQITRAEIAAVILRIHKLSIGGQEYIDNFMNENNMKPLQSLYVPVTTNDFQNVFTNAWDNNQAFVMYEYSFGIGSEEMRVLKENCFEGYRRAAVHYPEYSTFVSLNFKVTSDGIASNVTLDFDSSSDYYTYNDLSEQQKKAEKLADELVTDITSDCSNGKDKADRIHDYVAEMLEYDNSLSEASYTAYGALKNGTAVCQGYSGVFNLLCRSAGIKSAAVANDEHMWNVVLIDGEFYHYDTTFDDVNGEIRSDFKGIPEDKFLPDKDHSEYVLPNAEDMF